MPLVYTVQQHIHLGLLGASLSMYQEPPVTLYHIDKRAPHFDMTTSFNRSRKGNPAFHVLSDDTDTPLFFRDFEYEVRVTDAELETLLLLQGKIINLVDNRHCPDYTDHSPYIRKMAFMPITYDSNLTPMLEHNIITLMLKDAETRSSI